jgi:hypothetical protein
VSKQLDREGIFKALPQSWKVKQFDSSTAVAIEIEFAILAQLDGSEWVDWSNYEEHRVRGDFWVVKKTGQANIKTVEALRDAIGWNGSLKGIVGTKPPECVVQVTVKAEDYNGKTFYKAAFINPGDYQPGSEGADASEVDQLEARFGSLLRAAAGPMKAKAPAPKPAPAPVKQEVQDPNDAIPF